MLLAPFPPSRLPPLLRSYLLCFYGFGLWRIIRLRKGRKEGRKGDDGDEDFGCGGGGGGAAVCQGFFLGCIHSHFPAAAAAAAADAASQSGGLCIEIAPGAGRQTAPPPPPLRRGETQDATNAWSPVGGAAADGGERGINRIGIIALTETADSYRAPSVSSENCPARARPVSDEFCEVTLSAFLPEYNYKYPVRLRSRTKSRPLRAPSLLPSFLSSARQANIFLNFIAKNDIWRPHAAEAASVSAAAAAAAAPPIRLVLLPSSLHRFLSFSSSERRESQPVGQSSSSAYSRRLDAFKLHFSLPPFSPSFLPSLAVLL